MVEELIQEGEYQQALSMLNDMNDENTRYLRLVCWVGLGEYQHAKQEGLYAKANAKETYYDVVSMYVTTLKELGDYDEAIDILIEELSMPYIPYQYEMLFNTAYDQVLLEKQEAHWEVESKNQIFSIEEIEQILKNKECNDDLLYMALDQLQQLNIRLIIPTIRDYLSHPKRHYFAKSLLMEIMIEQQVDEYFEVEKFGKVYDFNPSYMPLVLQQDQYNGIIKYLENGLEDENPTLFQQCVEYLEYYLYSVYPQEIYEDEYHIMAATIHYYVATLQSISIDFEDLEIIYYCDKSEIEENILALKQIECD
ncbi:MAG: hypothetical protein HFF36_09495 [Coprobacillus sp.]|nr:hypothetical protein [Coprobacillus sp.]MCI9093994.1 hypothetical protein [Coprobacillus sp.]